MDLQYLLPLERQHGNEVLIHPSAGHRGSTKNIGHCSKMYLNEIQDPASQLRDLADLG